MAYGSKEWKLIQKTLREEEDAAALRLAQESYQPAAPSSGDGSANDVTISYGGQDKKGGAVAAMAMKTLSRGLSKLNLSFGKKPPPANDK